MDSSWNAARDKTTLDHARLLMTLAVVPPSAGATTCFTCCKQIMLLFYLTTSVEVFGQKLLGEGWLAFRRDADVLGGAADFVWFAANRSD